MALIPLGVTPFRRAFLKGIMMANSVRAAALAFSAAAAVVVAAPASAATPLDVTLTKAVDGTYSGEFKSDVTKGTGTLLFNLIFPVSGVGQVSFSSSLAPRSGAQILSATLGGAALTINHFGGSYFGGADVDLSKGATLPLSVTYDARSAATINGNITFSAVPEPASWALMIGGFGLVGGFMRRRSVRSVKASIATA